MSNIALTYEKPPPNLHVLSSWGNRLLWHRAKRGRPLLTFNKFAFLDFSIAEKSSLLSRPKELYCSGAFAPYNLFISVLTTLIR